MILAKAEYINMTISILEWVFLNRIRVKAEYIVEVEYIGGVYIKMIFGALNINRHDQIYGHNCDIDLFRMTMIP